MPASLTALKQQLCELGRRMWHRGFCAGNDGNCSCRITRDRVLSTPTGFSKGFMQPPMMTLVNLDGRQLAPPPTSRYRRTTEIFLHLAIYRRRPDVRAIIHAHAPHATAFACAGIPLPHGIYPEAEVCLGAVPTVPYTRAGYAELGAAAAHAIQPDTSALLLGNHGVVCFAATLEEAWFKLEMLDSYCHILLLLRQLGHVSLLAPSQMRELLDETPHLPRTRRRAPLSRLAQQPFIQAIRARH